MNPHVPPHKPRQQQISTDFKKVIRRIVLARLPQTSLEVFALLSDAVGRQFDPPAFCPQPAAPCRVTLPPADPTNRLYFERLHW